MFYGFKSGSTGQSFFSPFALVLGALCFGTIPYFARIGFSAGISPGVAVLLRYILPAVILAPYLPLALKSGPSSRHYALFGLIMGLGAWSYFYALSALPTYLAASLFFSYPALLACLRALSGEKLRGSDKLVLLLVASALLIILAATPLPSLDFCAIMIGLIGPLCYGGLQLVSRRTPSYLPSVSIAACIFAGAVIAAIPFALVEFFFWQGTAETPSAQPIFGLVVIAGALPQFLLAYGSSESSGRKSAYTTGFIEFGLAIAISLWVFTEPLGLGQALGFTFLLIALYLTNEPARLPRYLQD